MTTIMPTDKNLRHAIAWIEEHRCTQSPLVELMNEAGQRFNLGPLEEQALVRFYADQTIPQGLPR